MDIAIPSSVGSSAFDHGVKRGSYRSLFSLVIEPIMLPAYALGIALGAVVVLHWLLEVHYFLRMMLTVVHARFFKTNVGILDDTSVHGECD